MCEAPALKPRWREADGLPAVLTHRPVSSGSTSTLTDSPSSLLSFHLSVKDDARVYLIHTYLVYFRWTIVKTQRLIQSDDFCFRDFYVHHKAVRYVSWNRDASFKWKREHRWTFLWRASGRTNPAGSLFCWCDEMFQFFGPAQLMVWLSSCRSAVIITQSLHTHWESAVFGGTWRSGAHLQASC